MPDNYLYLNQSGNVCTNLNGLNGEFCFPELVQCIETDDEGFLQDCDNPYCVFRCENDPTGEIPFVRGDKIMIQTQMRDLYNVDPKNPETGWNEWIFLHIYDAETMEAFIFDEIDFRKYVAHTGRNSFQVIEIDTGLENFPCAWFAEIYAYKLEEIEGMDTLVEIDCRRTHNYREIDECATTYTVEGLYEKYDCKGNFYGEVENSFGDDFFVYSNKTRIEGGLLKRQPTVSNDEGITTITENYRFTTSMADSYSGVFVPNYLISWYTNIFAAKNVNINNNLEIISNFAVTYEEQTENAAVVNFDWSVNCNNCT